MIRVRIINDQWSVHKWWINFLSHPDQRDPSGLSIIDEDLKKYNAKWLSSASGDGPWIEFNSNEDYLMFMLMWS